MSGQAIPDFSGTGAVDNWPSTKPMSENAAPASTARHIGDFELLEEIARGGMGVVYRARQISLNRTVALKLLRSGQLASESEVARFRAEAEAAANLDHPNIVPIYEVGEYEGRHYFTMKLIEGGNLAQRISDYAGDRHAAVRLLITIARAVDLGHRHGVLHRDLKPSNILIDSDGRAYVSDFGLAKRIEDQSITHSEAVLGTPSYMAPEQAAGRTKEITVASDVYGLGSILYHMLTGAPPFRADSILETLRQVQENEPVSVRRINPRIDRDLETITHKALAKDPAQRYVSAAALARDLECWLEGGSIEARRTHTPERLWRWCKRKPALASMIALTVLMLVSVAVGASIFSAKLLRAEHDKTEQLRKAYQTQAKATRWSRRQGQRYESLDALAKAAAIRPSVDLRNDAVAALALADMRTVWTMPKASSTPLPDTFDPAFKRAAMCSLDGTITLHEIEGPGKLVLPGAGVRPAVIHFSADGRRLAAKYHNFQTDNAIEVKVWDTTTGKPLFEQRTLRVNGRAICLSADGSRLALGDVSNEVIAFDVDSGRELWRQRGALPHSFAPHPGDKLLAVASNVSKDIFIRRWSDGEMDHMVSVNAAVWDITFNPDGTRLGIASANRWCYVWDMHEHRFALSLAQHDAEAVKISFDPTGDLIATYGWDTVTRLWSSRTGRQLLSVDSGEGEGFSPDGRRLSYFNNDHLGLWEVAVGRECTEVLVSYGGKVCHSMRISPDGRLFAITAPLGVLIGEVGAAQVRARLPVMNAYAAQFTPDGSRLVVASPAGVDLYPVRAGDHTLTIGPLARRIKLPGAGRGALSPDGTVFIVVQDSRVHWIDVDTMTVTGSSKPAGNFESVEISPDGRWVAVTAWHGAGVHIFDLKTREQVAHLMPDERNTRAEFSPAGDQLAISTGTSYSFCRTSDWKQIDTFRRGSSSDIPGRLAYSTDGKTLAVTNNNYKTLLIDTATRAILCELEAPHPLSIDRLAFAGGDRYLVAAVQDNRVNVWDLSLIRSQLDEMNLNWGEPVKTPPRHSGKPVTITIETK